MIQNHIKIIGKRLTESVSCVIMITEKLVVANLNNSEEGDGNMEHVVQMIMEYIAVIGVSAFMIGVIRGVKRICREILMRRYRVI